MNLEAEAAREIVELREFYSRNDLADYVKMCSAHGLPLYECVLFLRGQTVNDYKLNDTRPNIAEMAVRTYVWYQETRIGTIKGKP